MAYTKEQIARIMRGNKNKDTKPELLLRKELWQRGLRYRKNCKYVIGTPDIVFLGLKIAVFVDGHMWHGYDWERQQSEFKLNRDYWIPKIEMNRERDIEVTQDLISLGWVVLRFWDFEIEGALIACADKIELTCKNRKDDMSLSVRQKLDW